MKRTEWFIGGTVAVLAIVASITAPRAFAQGPQDGPPPQGGPQGGGRPPRRNPPPISAATLPMDLLTSYLKLNATQASKVQEINAALREEMRPPRPVENGDGTPPTPPSPGDRDARGKTMNAAIKKASDSVTALLDDGQKTKLATLLNAFQAFRVGRVPPPAVKDLKLTDEQWTKIGALGKSATHETITALLTDEQKTVLESSRPGPGGPEGGPGGRRGPGGRPGDGPPPPDGGPEGPPPPPDAF